ncbi:Adenine phosphoribosyltransferase 3 [Hibiscus syriacus]|uniref:adenine phosphoribosyltransferase n=1 Tax=Hibiscus syriacus TaxID=106335 RepID=A0A6A3A697_HIBSY|nr:Adenine phosphoribosyltransferase 3 [Hibiscus syriacus]
MFAGDQNGLQGDPRLKAISEAIRVVPHFPKPGIMFQDITTLLLDHKAFKDTVDIFVDRYRDMGEVISEAYILEYGTDCLEMHVGAVQPGERALVIDDLVATGGTLSAAIRLLERVGAQVIECACVVGLREVKGQHGLKGNHCIFLWSHGDRLIALLLLLMELKHADTTI